MLKTVQDGVKKVEQTVMNAGQKAVAALCNTSVGKPVCDIVKDAASCYWSVQKTIKDAPAQVKDAIKSLTRWNGGIAGVTLSIVKNFDSFRDNVRNAAKQCWDWVARSAKKIVDTAKEAVCRTSWGKPVCDVIADAADCYRQVRATVVSAPVAVRNAINSLARWQGGIAVATTGSVKSFSAVKRNVEGAIKACKDWAGRTTMKVAEALCGKNETCKKFIDALKAEGITTTNWTNNKAKVALVALRFAVPEGVSRKIALSAEISGAVYKVTGSDPYDLDSDGNGLGCE